MYQTHNWLVRTYDFVPENYELKPPLLTWIQVGSMQLFGLNELAIRLPSVVFSLITLFLLFLLVYHMTRNHYLGLLASTIVATSAGFYAEHVGRFGDHDALLVCICTWLFYNVYHYSATQKTRYIYLAATSIAVGVLCKSIAIGMVLPGIFLFLLYDRKVLVLLRNKHTYLAFLVASIPIVAYYVLREQVQPGYLNLVWNNELFPRFFNTAPDIVFQENGFDYYFGLLKNTKMEFWVWSFILIGLAPILTKRVDNNWAFWCIPAATFLFIISCGTKNFWYLAPVIPLLAGAVATSVFIILRNKPKLTFWIVIPLVGLATLSYHKAYQYSLHPSEKYYEWETNGISYFLKDEEHLKKITRNTEILLDTTYGYEPHLFYVKKMRLENNLPLERTILQHVSPGDTLLMSHQSCYDALQQKWKTSVLDSSFSHTKLVAVGELLF
jgi:4-amino-4-deoxy-L-arabinose transferase-like glycosyltransferase